MSATRLSLPTAYNQREYKDKKMPKTIQYHKLTKTLSTPRIASYRDTFNNYTEEEVFGCYLWNKALCGAIYPIIQASEVALRNSIDAAARELYGDYWNETISHFHTRNEHGQTVNNENYKKFKEEFKKAKKSVIRNLAKKRTIPDGYTPPFDKVVAETSFATWEYVLHRCFFKTGDNDFLWPKKTRKAFANWPERSSRKTHIRIYDLVAEIRPFRNRISHHEPLWKGTNVTNEIEAIEFVSKKISAIEELLNIICTEKVKYLHLQNMFGSARSLCSTSGLDRFRYRTKNQTLSLKHKRKVKKFLFDAYNKEGETTFEYGGRRYLIRKL